MPNLAGLRCWIATRSARHSTVVPPDRIALPRSKEDLQMATPPEWISALANNVSACLEPLEPMPPLGCHYHHCPSGWEVTIFPSVTEIVGGPEDGRKTAPRFRVDILGAANLFNSIDNISWQSRTVNEDDQLGAHLSIDGMIDDEIVSVRILKSAPPCFAPGRKAFTNQGCLIETW